jgi:hypothetical protein
VWLDYIRFELTEGSLKLNDSIYSKGLWKLEPNLRNAYMDEYNNIKNEFMLVLYMIYIILQLWNFNYLIFYFRKQLGSEIIVIDDD